MTAVDLFAGAGGSTTGATQANVRVLWAGNHWRSAYDCHLQNHPGVAHGCQDLHQQNWLEVPSHDLTLASPACQGHTPARGKEQPHHDASRSTAWAVVSCVEAHQPKAGFVVENVQAFLKWKLFPAWKMALEQLGYSLAPHIIDAADHGVPQHRKRVFIVGVWGHKPLVLSLPKRSHVSFATVIESAPCTSPVADLCEATRARVERGRSLGRRFLVPYYSNGSGQHGRSIERPIGTLTTKDRWRLVDGDLSRMITVNEIRKAMGFPDSYTLPANVHVAKHLLGNAVCPPVMRDLLAELKRRI